MQVESTLIVWSNITAWPWLGCLQEIGTDSFYYSPVPPESWSFDWKTHWVWFVFLFLTTLSVPGQSAMTNRSATSASAQGYLQPAFKQRDERGLLEYPAFNRSLHRQTSQAGWEGEGSNKHCPEMRTGSSAFCFVHRFSLLCHVCVQFCLAKSA